MVTSVLEEHITIIFAKTLVSTYNNIWHLNTDHNPHSICSVQLTSAVAVTMSIIFAFIVNYTDIAKKLHSKTMTTLNSYSSEDTSPWPDACIHMQICTIITASAQSLNRQSLCVLPCIYIYHNFRSHHVTIHII